MKRLILCIFNRILNTGHFPEQWAQGLIVPLHKKGPKDIVNNYRGITLLPTINKVFSDIIYQRLLIWSETYFPLIEEQSGFRKKYSTADNISILHTIVMRYLHLSGRLYCAFIDFDKGFDRVNH